MINWLVSDTTTHTQTPTPWNTTTTSSTVTMVAMGEMSMINWLGGVTNMHTPNRSISSSKVPPTYTSMTTTSRGWRMIWVGRRLPAMPTSAPGVGTKLGVVLAKLFELIVTQKSKQVCVGTSVITNIESLSLKVD